MLGSFLNSIAFPVATLCGNRHGATHSCHDWVFAGIMFELYPHVSLGSMNIDTQMNTAFTARQSLSLRLLLCLIGLSLAE